VSSLQRDILEFSAASACAAPRPAATARPRLWRASSARSPRPARTRAASEKAVDKALKAIGAAQGELAAAEATLSQARRRGQGARRAVGGAETALLSSRARPAAAPLQMTEEEAFSVLQQRDAAAKAAAVAAHALGAAEGEKADCDRALKQFRDAVAASLAAKEGRRHGSAVRPLPQHPRRRQSHRPPCRPPRSASTRGAPRSPP